MNIIFGILAVVFGAALGSFINVIALRYNTGLSFLKGRSICFSCGSPIEKRDMFPIFSFLLLRGKCRHCGSKIPAGTFWVEVVMAVLSVMALFKSGLFSLELRALSLEMGVNYLLITFIFAVILLISIYDLRHFIIPDSFLVVFAILAFVYHLSIFQSFNLSILYNILSGVILALPLLLLFLISKGAWIGFGDIKYTLVLGFFLGIVQGLSALTLAFWVGAVFSLALLALRKYSNVNKLPIFAKNLTMKSEIPFGPFISIGIILSFYFNADIFQIHSILNL